MKSEPKNRAKNDSQPTGYSGNIEDNFPTARSRQDDSSQTLILDS